MSSSPTRTEEQLGPEDRRRLAEAHRRLREAVAGYEPFIARSLGAADDVPAYNAGQVAEAQLAVEDAERELWRLREVLLGWTRPAWAPSATLVADWFSDDDAAYDDVVSAAEQ